MASNPNGHNNRKPINPFDDDESECYEDEYLQETNSKEHAKSWFRGLLISGSNPRSDDIESGTNSLDREQRAHAPKQFSPKSNSSNRPITDNANLMTKIRRRPLWIGSIAGAVVLVIVLSVLVFRKYGNEDDVFFKPLTSTQKFLKDAAASISSSETLKNTSSPQYRALKWLLFEDEFLGTSNGNVTTERVIQRYVLSIFYFATNGFESWKPNAWLLGNECSENPWDGINCNKLNQVRTISLDNFGGIGSIPPEMGHLSMLENLILKNERGLTGSIPSTLGHLSSLRQLGLYNNSLSGSIPPEMFRATTLRYLNLQDNKLIGKFPNNLELLKQLERLAVMNNKLEGQVHFEKLKAVHFLGLSNNSFTGTIPETIGNFAELQFLYLDGNKFHGQLPSSIGDARYVRALNIDNNNITGTIPTDMTRLKHLEFLSMSNNNISGPLPQNLGEMDSLRALNLASNRLSGPLPDFFKMTRLSHLYLFKNEFTGSIPESITRLKSLEVLFLSSNKLTGSVQVIGETVGDGSNLRGLYLSDNLFEGSIPNSLCNLASLESLFLDENALTGTIPPCFARLKQLQQMYLFRNQLSGDVPAALSQLDKLGEIGIEGNNITGKFPEEICSSAENRTVDFWSDCGGDAPELTCPCCSVCCPGPQCTSQ